MNSAAWEPAARSPAEGLPPDRRVWRAALVVPAAILAPGAALSAVDLRLGFLASAVVLGWTQLVGL